MARDEIDPAARIAELDKANRVLARKLARLDANVRQTEKMQDATSKILSGLTRELEAERAKSEELLRNILPQAIIDRLEAGERVIADRYDRVAVLFSDLVGFTETSSSMDPAVLVSELNALFSRFDAMCERRGVEKIKTIGDAYLAVGGLPGTREDPVDAVADLALDMVEAVHEVGGQSDRPWRIRIGLHVGPAVAGVIGTRKFVYDVWGDTVNVASRLETTSEPGRVQMSGDVAEALGGGFEIEPRGEIELKGKGTIPTFFLTGRRR